MEINEFQKEVEEFFKKISEKEGKNLTTDEIFIHLVEEIGEIARELTNKRIRKEKFDVEKLREEIADCIVFLSALASGYEINLEEALRKDIEKLNQKI